MKLLVQGDDYGFTKGVTYGILDAIDNGVLRNTGMFPNMPIAPWAAEQWKAKERPQACLGIDFNIVSGPSTAAPKSVPSLVDDKGEFIRSGARLKDPRFQTEEGRREMFPYEEVYREIRAQYDRFVASRSCPGAACPRTPPRTRRSLTPWSSSTRILWPTL